MVSSALGVDYRKLLGDPSKYQTAYDSWRGKSEYDLIHDTSMTISSIHKHLEKKPYDLIGINVLLKVGGTGAKEDHDKFQALGEECRRIAQTYGPVIAIVQADPTAEGMQYIPQDRIYKSKTALQGEADGLIMIGTDEQIEDDVRYIHVAKNKIPPAQCTNIKDKHIKSRVKFEMDTGRFLSKNFDIHSRTSK
jgi:TPR repeat protein